MNIKLDRDTITPELKHIMREVKSPLPLYQAGAKAVQVELTKHLRALEARGNKRGWPSKKFFAGGPDSVEKRVGVASISNSGAEITIADPRFVHRIEGGTVTPKRRKLLAIPLTAEAYRLSGTGSLRESMPGLKVWRFPRGLFLVKETEERRTKSGKVTKGKGGGISRMRVLPLFKLVRSVTHSPKPDEMPKAAELGAAAGRAMLTAARLLLKATPQ